MNILIVDDSATQRLILKSIANNHPSINNIFEATDGLKALEVITSESIDFIFSDINMEPMSGLELISKCHEINPDISFAFMSSHLTDTMKKSAVDAGGKFYITKPLTQEKIEEVLNQVTNA